MRQRRLLVVDDIASNRELLRIMLTRMGDVAAVSVNGIGAIAAVPRRPFDVMPMNVKMREMDGGEAIQRIRALGGQAGQVPILALTAGASDADQARSQAAGMNMHVSKPVGRARLAEVLAPLRG